MSYMHGAPVQLWVRLLVPGQPSKGIQTDRGRFAGAINGQPQRTNCYAGVLRGRAAGSIWPVPAGPQNALRGPCAARCEYRSHVLRGVDAPRHANDCDGILDKRIMGRAQHIELTPQPDACVDLKGPLPCRGGLFISAQFSAPTSSELRPCEEARW